MQYKEILGWLDSINGIANQCNEGRGLFVTFEPRAPQAQVATVTVIDKKGNILGEVMDNTLIGALLGTAVDLDPRFTDYHGSVSVAGLLNAVKPTAIKAMTKLKKEIQDEMHRAGDAGDYAKAAALRQKSVGVTMAIRIADEATR